MATLPRTKDSKIEYFEQRLEQWQADPAAVGLTPELLDALAALVSTARGAYTGVQQAKQELRNMVNTQDTAIENMMGLGSAVLAIIRAFADATSVTEGPDAGAQVFAAGRISPASARAPAPAPTPATNLRAALLKTGGLKLSWNGTTANGTVYAIFRRINSEPSFTQIATSGTRSYEDQRVPTGATEVSYFLKTIRDDLISDDSETITVRLGVLPETASADSTGTGLGMAA